MVSVENHEPMVTILIIAYILQISVIHRQGHSPLCKMSWNWSASFDLILPSWNIMNTFWWQHPFPGLDWWESWTALRGILLNVGTGANVPFIKCRRDMWHFWNTEKTLVPNKLTERHNVFFEKKKYWEEKYKKNTVYHS